MKIIKQLFSKCSKAGQLKFLALLDWRDTPTECLGSSPAQTFLGRRCRTQLLLMEALLKPAYDMEAEARALQGKRQKQALYDNQQACDLPPLQAGATVRKQLPGEKRWTSCTCTGLQGPCSYGIRVGEAECWQKQTTYTLGRTAAEQPETTVRTQGSSTPDHSAEATHGGKELTPRPTITPGVHPQPEPPIRNLDPPLQLSTRQCRQPEWITTYIPS